MKLEQQVTSLELSKKLKELGVKQESYFVHDEVIFDLGNSVIRIKETETHNYHSGLPSVFSAFTVAELGEMLPWKISMLKNSEGRYVVRYWDIADPLRDRPVGTTSHVEINDNEANARATMLIYLIENGLTLSGRKE